MGAGASNHNKANQKNTIMERGMPLFKKKLDKEGKKYLQEKLRIAEEKPDSVFDLAECGFNKIPDGVYAKCKIFQKQALLLQHNLLDDLKHGGDLSNLAELLILDISFNCISTLPKSIKTLVKLQKLNISHNKLKKIPEEIGFLTDLQVLDLSFNDLSGLPPKIKNFRKLESLDISENKHLTNLPANLCYLNCLTDFKFDQQRITYPAKEITSVGIEEIKRWFKILKGDEFFHENDQSDGPIREPNSPLKSASPIGDDEFEESILARERKREKQAQERLHLEKEILDSQTENAQLLINSHQQRAQVMIEIEKHELEAQTALARQFDSENQERNKLLEQLYFEDNHLDETVNFVLEMSERAKHTEALLEEMEREQTRLDALVKVTQEESERLRKQEIIEAMRYILNEKEKSQRMWDEYESQREESWKKSIQSTSEDNKGLGEVLQRIDNDQRVLVQQIMTEEKKQKEAFQFMQFQKDVKLNRIKKQVDMIEAELARLSLLEIKKREEKSEQDLNTLAEMRIQTALLLSQLIDEQEKREERLKETIAQMEEQREDDAKDYWLIQFQRLMESKPQILVDAENRLDVFVVEVLMHAGAKEYLPHFARHRIDELKMHAMTKEILREIGVKDENIQEDILAGIKSSILMSEQVDKLEEAYVKRVKPTENPIKEQATATSSLLPSSIRISGESECVVCLDGRPEVVFLPCGHVCTCSRCCQPLSECPLCRQTIIQKCRLFGA